MDQFEIDPTIIEETAENICSLIDINSKLQQKPRIPYDIFTPTVDQLKEFFQKINEVIQPIIFYEDNEMLTYPYGRAQIVKLYDTNKLNIILYTNKGRKLFEIVVPYLKVEEVSKFTFIPCTLESHACQDIIFENIKNGQYALSKLNQKFANMDALKEDILNLELVDGLPLQLQRIDDCLCYVTMQYTSSVAIGLGFFMREC